jgi:hypothetical protein
MQRSLRQCQESRENDLPLTALQPLRLLCGLCLTHQSLLVGGSIRSLNPVLNVMGGIAVHGVYQPVSIVVDAFTMAHKPQRVIWRKASFDSAKRYSHRTVRMTSAAVIIVLFRLLRG